VIRKPVIKLVENMYKKGCSKKRAASAYGLKTGDTTFQEMCYVLTCGHVTFSIANVFRLLLYRSFATRVSQLKIWHFFSYWYRKKCLQMHF